MPGLPWFKVASDFPAHPKTLRLCALLGDANAGMYVVRLLAYCATYAPDGRVPLDMIKQASGWTKQRSSVELLTSSLVQAGFIVCTATHAEIHGWDEWNGAHVRKSAKDNARPRSDRRVPRAGTSRDDGGNSSGSRAGDVEGEKREKKQLPSPATSAGGAEESTQAGSLFPPQPAAPKSKRGASAEKPPDPRHAPMTAALVAAYVAARGGKYGFHKRDPRAVTEILALCGGDTAEAVRRFTRGLGETFRSRCDSICDLPDRWNALGGHAPAVASGKPRVISDIGTHTSEDWDAPSLVR